MRILVLNFFFAHTVRYDNSVTFRIWVTVESLQYLDHHEPQRFDFCIECKPSNRTWQLHYHQVNIMIIKEEINILVSGAFLKCFSIYKYRFGGSFFTRRYFHDVRLIFKL